MYRRSHAGFWRVRLAIQEVRVHLDELRGSGLLAPKIEFREDW